MSLVGQLQVCSMSYSSGIQEKRSSLILAVSALKPLHEHAISTFTVISLYKASLIVKSCISGEGNTLLL